MARRALAYEDAPLRALLVLLGLSLGAGCSLTMTGPAGKPQPTRMPACSEDAARPVLDTVVAGLSLMVAYAFADAEWGRSCAPEAVDCGLAGAGGAAIVTGAIGLAFGLSATRGYIVRNRCHATWRQHERLRVLALPPPTTPVKRIEHQRRVKTHVAPPADPR